MTNITVRKAHDTDAAALSALVCDVLYASNLADYGPANIARVAGHFTPDGVVTMINDRLQTYVALADGRIVGTASLDLSEDSTLGVVKTFFVDARLQGQGIGAQLFARLVAKAATYGVSRFTVRSSIAAVPFYQRLGFVVVCNHWDGNERTIEMRNW